MEASSSSKAQYEDPASTSMVDQSVNTAGPLAPTVQANGNTENKVAEKEEDGVQGTQGFVPTVNVDGIKETAARGWNFWAIFIGLCITGLLAAVDGTVTSTALPTIVHNLDAQGLYVWFVNAFFLCSTCALPLYGQLANIFGRRWVTIGAVAMFMFGSGICGGAQNPAMMIAGRALQGIGQGGISVMIDIIVSDLLPLRLRQKFMGIVWAVFMLGTTLGPFIGGIIVQTTSWRWVFYINLPIGAVALALLIAFLHTEYDRKTSFREKLKRIDYLGNGILISSTVSVLIALSWAGTTYPWASAQVLVPLLVGFAGTAGFHILQASPWVVEPTMPGYLFSTMTTVSGYLQAFTNSMLIFWSVYFLPLYFQAVLGSSPARSGVQFLPSVIIGVPFAIIAGLLLTAFGRYKPIHIVSWALKIIGLGLYTTLNAESSTGEWTGYQIIQAVGTGMLMSALLPCVQAGLPESDVATATATFQFVRAYGSIWGFAIPAAIFNSQFSNLAYRISNEEARALFGSGAAYSHVSTDFINSFGPVVKGEILGVYSDSLRTLWQVALGIGGFSFLIVFMEREIKLRTELDTKFGLKNEKKVMGSVQDKASGESSV